MTTDLTYICIIKMNSNQNSSSRPGAGKGVGPGNGVGWPSTHPGQKSGPNRSNNAPKKVKGDGNKL